VDSLEAQLRSYETGSTSPSDVPINGTAEIEVKITLYEQKMEQLSKLLNEEEAAHRDLVEKLESKVEELQQAVVSSKASSTPSESMSPVPTTVVVPVTKSKLKVLEQRIMEMTLSLEEKDKTIFDLGMEIDKVKVELNQVRVEAARVPELLTAIHDLESKTNPTLEDEASVPPIEEVTAPDTTETDNRIAALELTVQELTAQIESLKAEKSQIEETRAELVEEVPEAQIDHLAALRERLSHLEECLEISEMNRKLLRENFAKENEEKLALQVELDRMRAQPSPPPPTVETSGGAFISVEDAGKLLKVQQIQIETLTLEVNTLRSLPGQPVDPPSPPARGCFSFLFRK
jgi:chromosome segregation ATPase